MHPADADMHKDEEHKFDMKEVYLFRRGKDVLTGSFNNVREGDVLLMPVVMKRQGDGSFRPLMEQGTLLMTSKLTVREPGGSGPLVRHSGKGYAGRRYAGGERCGLRRALKEPDGTARRMRRVFCD